ncbi:outer membrane lipoprotein-sorting protein [Natronoflexus pectinivorans]|uniref:Outer membrane lipoprotein-sorting protein n=1 Tax=Natronoflexus pectinivorans TaxID=682526 RepID=A0A4R2GHB4_9BACT|nr:outer membrane lipoprotein-sorting protein [Natronoflexus pectinivorans]TCO07442.1 outer membrane lipoprotein-sorting protein [Natronoflexus pectinivorans]
MNRLILIIAALLFCNFWSLQSQTPKELFRESLEKIARQNIHLEIELESTNRRGNSRVREMDVFTSNIDDVRYVKVELLSPDEVKGVKIVTSGSEENRGTVEIFMPATGRVQRLRSYDNPTVMGSEIPLDQLNFDAYKNYGFSMETREMLNGLEHHKLKLESTDDEGWFYVWISVDEVLLNRIERFNAAGVKSMVTEMSDYHVVSHHSGALFPGEIQSTNLQSNEQSVMRIRSVQPILNPSKEDYTL